MTSTRLVTAVVFVVGSVGFVIIEVGENLATVVVGAMLIVASSIVFARHFWRESDRKRKQELAAYEGAVRATIANLPLEQLREDVSSVSRRVDVFTQGVLEYVAQLELDIADEGQRQRDATVRLKKDLDSIDRRALKYRDDILTQLPGVFGVYSTLKPSRPYPSFGGWAIGGDCAQRFVRLILSKEPRWIIEAGSGLSTVLASQALEQLRGDGQIISLEHEADWLEQSEAMVAEHGLTHRSQILYTPLVDVLVGDEVFSWYDLSQVDLPDEVEIIFIDGPPKATGPLARYPALPILHKLLATGGVFLMDDAGRPDERAAIERWKEEFTDLDFRYHTDAKGTVEITRDKR